MKKLCSLCLACLLCISFLNVSIHAQEEVVAIRSTYAIVVNLNDERIMYEKNAYEKMYPASMTKMMSVLVAIEAIEDINATYTFEKDVFEGQGYQKQPCGLWHDYI